MDKGDFSLAGLNEYELRRRPFMKTVDITSRSVDSLTFAKGRFKLWLRRRQTVGDQQTNDAKGIPRDYRRSPSTQR